MEKGILLGIEYTFFLPLSPPIIDLGTNSQMAFFVLIFSSSTSRPFATTRLANNWKIDTSYQSDRGKNDNVDLDDREGVLDKEVKDNRDDGDAGDDGYAQLLLVIGIVQL